MYYKITNQFGVLQNGMQQIRPDVSTSDLPVQWLLINFYNVSDLNEEFAIEIWDNDSNSDDELMGTVTFQMSDYVSGGNAYPIEVTKAMNGTSV